MHTYIKVHSTGNLCCTYTYVILYCEYKKYYVFTYNHLFVDLCISTCFTFRALRFCAEPQSVEAQSEAPIQERLRQGTPRFPPR